MATRTRKAAEAKPTAESTSDDKPKRKSYTDEERVAKLEAELKAVRERQAEKADKRRAELTEKRDKLSTKIDEQRKELAAIDAELERLANSEPVVPITTVEDLEPAEQAS